MYSQITRDELHRYFFRQLALDRWITLPNGVHCWIDGGEITRGPRALQGKHLQDLDGTNGISILRDTAPKTDEYQKLLASNHGDHYRTTREFFRKNLQGKAVMTVIDGEECPVFFTGGSLDKFQYGIKDDPVKAEIVCHLADIVATGKRRRSPLHKQRTDGTLAFYSLEKRVRTSRGDFLVIVDIADRGKQPPSPVAYNVTREGTRNFEERKKKETARKIQIQEEKPAEDAGFASLTPYRRLIPGFSAVLASDVECLKNIISKEYEVVNIRIKD